MSRKAVVKVVSAVIGLALTGCASSELLVRQTVEQAAQTVEAGLNRRDVSAVDAYFATLDEGAIQTGLEQTREALGQFGSGLTASDQAQFHSFKVESVAVHESGNLARATYRLHFSIVRGGTIVFGAVVVQNLALVKTSRGWRISGGDVPQLSDVRGEWPPR